MLTAYVHVELTCDAPPDEQGHRCQAQMEFTTTHTLGAARKEMTNAAWRLGWQSSTGVWLCPQHRRPLRRA